MSKCSRQTPGPVYRIYCNLSATPEMTLYIFVFNLSVTPLPSLFFGGA